MTCQRFLFLQPNVVGLWWSVHTISARQSAFIAHQVEHIWKHHAARFLRSIRIGICANSKCLQCIGVFLAAGALLKISKIIDPLIQTSCTLFWDILTKAQNMCMAVKIRWNSDKDPFKNRENYSNFNIELRLSAPFPSTCATYLLANAALNSLTYTQRGVLWRVQQIWRLSDCMVLPGQTTRSYSDIPRFYNNVSGKYASCTASNDMIGVEIS